MPQLHILSGKRQGDVVELAAGAEVDIGNRKSARLSIRDPWVSYNHARIVVESGRFVIEDQDSSNGTWLDAPSGPKRIKRHELAPNDVFALGKTRIKFVGDVPAAATASFGSGPGLTRKLPQDQPWWDKNVQPDAPRDGLAQELEEERKMRQALERFLELPAGTQLGDAARAGALEREVQELKKKLERAGTASGGGEDVARTEKLRQEMMKRQVELEGRASAAEAKVVDLEQRLAGKSDQTRKEVSRAREKLQAEVDELKRDLEEARARAKELAAGGDGALGAERERGERLERELDEARGRARAAEERAEKLERELSEARQATAGAGPVDPAMREQLEQALSEAERWKAEHQAVIQEIDEISMEQIEIEDGLKARVRDLEAQLAALGSAPPPAEAPAPRIRAGSGSSGTGRVVEAATSMAPRGDSAQASPAPSGSMGGSMGSYDSASLGVLPRSELGAPAIEDGDMDGSADTTSNDELT